MEQIEGLEKLINLLSSKNIVTPSFIIFIVGLPFFFPSFLLFLSVPQIVINYGEWIKFSTYFSFVVLVVNIFIFCFKKINFIFHSKKEINKLRKDILSLSGKEREIFLLLFFQQNNRFIMDEPAIIELQRKNLIDTFSNMGEQTVKNGKIICIFPYSITTIAMDLIKKDNLIQTD